jgi:hypothetical protein
MRCKERYDKRTSETKAVITLIQIFSNASALLLSESQLSGFKRRINIGKISVLPEVSAVVNFANSQVLSQFRAHMVVAKVSRAEKAFAYFACARQRCVPSRVAFSHPLADEARQFRLTGRSVSYRP